MTDTKEKKFFGDPANGGLNADDADFAVGINQWVNMENCRTGSTDKGQIMTVESIGSTLLLSSPQPSVTFITLKMVEDIPKRRIYYFQNNIYTPDDRILCWDDNLNRFYTVLLSIQVTGGLNFNKDYPIDAEVIGDLLYWTDNYTDPKRINIEAAIRLNQPEYDGGVAAYTSPLAQSVTTLIRRPPGNALGGIASTDPTRVNFLRDFAGQFAWRYIYRDGETSAFSPPSDLKNYRYDFGAFSGANGDNSNVFQLGLTTLGGASEPIDQDVQAIQFAVRYDNNPQYFIIKEFDKDNPSDAAAIAAYNAGGSLAYNFYNDEIGIPVSISESTKLYDSVPNLSETLQTALQRLFLGNNTIGYDTPPITSLTATATAVTTTGVAQKIFKPYSSYQVGIRFRDYYKRQCGVITKTSLIVQMPDRGDYNTNTFVQNIAWTLSNANARNEIPDWAYYYDILITKNLTTRYFLQFIPNSIKYAVKNNDGTFSYQNNYASNVYGIAFGTDGLFGQGMGINVEEGDLLRVYLNNLSTAPFTLNLINQDANYIITRPINLGDLGSLSTPVLLDYYKPYLQQEIEPFYTAALFNKISAPATDGRQYSTLSGNIEGDVFFTERAVTLIPAYYTASQSPNDNHWKDYFGIYGEVNIVTKLGREVKTGSIKWSDTIIEGSNINGLSTFDALDEVILPLDMGALRKLQLTSKEQAKGNVMLAICESNVASIYLGETQTYGSDQAPEQVLAIDKIIGTINVLKGDFGTINPESVIEYRGNVYWVDIKNGRVIQYASNGLYPISNYKMTRFWKLYCAQFLSMTKAQIEALGGRPFIYTAVDPAHDELLVSLPKLLNTPPKGYLPDYPSTIYPFDIYDGQAKTLVYDLKPEPNHWIGAYSFVAESFVILSNKLFSSKSGQLYLHNQTSSYNQFYGVSYKSRIMFLCNQSPNRIKVYNNISVEEGNGTLLPSLTYFRTESPYQQASDLVDFSWKNLEGNLYTTILRDKLIPTATGFSISGLLIGEKMRSYVLKVLMEWTITTVPIELRFVTVGYNDSLGQTT